MASGRLYLRLLRVPGAVAYGFFQPSILQTINRLMVNCKSNIVDAKGSTTHTEGKSNQHKKRKHSALKEVDDEDDIESEGGMLPTAASSSDNNSPLTSTRLCFIMKEISLTLKSIALSSYKDVRDSLIDTMLDVMKGLEGSHGVIYTAANNIITSLISSFHGDATSACNLLCRGLILHISMSYGNIKGSMVPSGHKECRKQGISLLLSLLDEVGEIQHDKDNDDEDNTPLLTSIYGLCQHLCSRVSDKAELRSSASEAIVTLMSKLSESASKHATAFTQYLTKYASSTKVLHRLFAVEVSTKYLLVLSEEEDDESVLSNKLNGLALTLLHILTARAADVGATVRSKALSGISDVLDSAYKNSNTLLLSAALLNNKMVSNANENYGSMQCKSESISLLLRRRLKDDKSVVRKAALNGIETIARITQETASNNNTSFAALQFDDVIAVGNATQDEAVSVRKQAINTLCILLTTFSDSERIQKLWLDCTLPLVYDPEGTVQTRAQDAIVDFLINPFTLIHKWVTKMKKKGGESIATASDISDEIVFSCQLYNLLTSDHVKCIHQALKLLSRSGRLDAKSLLPSLQSVATYAVDHPDFYLSQSLHSGSWIVLEGLVLTTMGDKNVKIDVDPEFVTRTWSTMMSGSDDDIHGVKRVLHVLTAVAPLVAANEATRLAGQLLHILLSFSASTDLIHSIVMALHALCAAKAPDDKAAKSMTISWSNQLFDASLIVLKRYVYNSNDNELPSDVTDATIVNHLYTIGEIAMLGVEIDCDDKKVGIVSIPSQIVTLTQALIAPTLVQLTTSNNDSTCLSDNIRAHAFITLGKICLRDSSLAKGCITTFIKELEVTNSPAIRNNILLVVGDLCRRYTGMVDRYIPNLASCLRDDSALVRQHSLMLLTQVCFLLILT